MVRYLDPEDHPELGEEQRHRSSPGQRLARVRERNAALTGSAAIEAAREVALRKLDARACSRAELTSAIEGRGFSADLALQVVDRLEAVGLVDDQAYADALVRSRFSGTGASGRALREVLVRKGLEPGVIERALSQISSDVRPRGPPSSWRASADHWRVFLGRARTGACARCWLAKAIPHPWPPMRCAMPWMNGMLVARTMTKTGAGRCPENG